VKSEEFQFRRLPEPHPGMGFGKYYGWNLRASGRRLFMNAMQELAEDLPPDPWEGVE